MFQPLRRARPALAGGCAVLFTALLAAQSPRVVLAGFAVLAADTFSGGPASGRFRVPDARGEGFASQPVQGFSGVRPDPERPGWWLALCDNGYGSKANSPDFLLRIYRVRPNWRSASGGAGSVEVGPYIQLSDPQRHTPFRIVREDTPERWLTGSDFDPESFVRAPDGTFWIGDEFGPFLLHVDRDGRLLAPPVDYGGFRSPDHPSAGVPDAGETSDATVRRSRGFEGLASSDDGARLFAMLETGPITDPPDQTRILEFDAAKGRFTGRMWKYRLDAAGLDATELVAYAPGRFLTIERDGTAGPGARIKRVFAVRLGEPPEVADKQLIADLMVIDDGARLAGLGPVFTFPFITTEAIWPEDAATLVIVNDNNYPGGGGRPAAGPKDSTEFIRLRLRQPLPK